MGRRLAGRLLDRDIPFVLGIVEKDRVGDDILLVRYLVRLGLGAPAIAFRVGRGQQTAGDIGMDLGAAADHLPSGHGAGLRLGEVARNA